MTAFRVDDVTISAVLEAEAPVFGIRELIPDLDDEILTEEAPRVAPRWIDLDRGKLVTTFQSYVIETPRRTILVDTGVGNDKTGRRRDFYNNAHSPFLDNLRVAGYAPEDIDLVVLTHIHVDHVGWNTRLVDGRWMPTFPKARYIIVGEELRDAEHKSGTEPARYGALWADSLVPVIEAGLVEEVGPDHQLDPAVQLGPSPGHTANHVSVWIGEDVPRAVVTGDVLHHPVQARHPDLNSQACALAAVARTTRRMMLEQCAAEGVLALPIHFAPCRVRASGKVWDFTAP
jgi:glyoxylase-like metal-dependent hydrolase (beta-lactamase superfamily II)